MSWFLILKRFLPTNQNKMPLAIDNDIKSSLTSNVGIYFSFANCGDFFLLESEVILGDFFGFEFSETIFWQIFKIK
jgi:hypothetical protein